MRVALNIVFMCLLLPFSLVWNFIYRVRRFAYSFGLITSRSFHVPIISVGNLTFGGTGKTPFTLWLANHFEQCGDRVMVLTRGYKGALENKSGILHTEKRLGFNPYLYGDEATMLVRRLKNAVVVVGKRRAQNLDYYFDQEEPDIVLLDDGHQHLHLKRDLNIVLFDALLPLERYRVAPAGYLREGLNALSDADLVVIGRVDQVSEEHLAQLKKLLFKNMTYSVPIVEMFYQATDFKNSSFETVYDLEQIKNCRVICLAGVASPQSFFDLVAGLGAEVIDCLSFPDHHHFDSDEMIEIVDDARKRDALIVTTEKDIVKIGRLIDDPRIIHLEIKVDFREGKQHLLEKLNQLRLTK